MSKFFSLLCILSPNQLRQHFFKLLITFLGIMLGAATFTAINVANDGVVKSLDTETSFFGRKIDVIINAPESQHLSEVFLTKLSCHPDVASALPYNEQFVVSIHDKEQIRVRGIDLIQVASNVGSNQLNEGTVAVTGYSRKYAGDLQLVINSEVRNVRVEKFAEELQIPESAANDLIVDLSQFSTLFSIGSGVQSIGVVMRGGVDSEKFKELIATMLPQGSTLDDPKDKRLEVITRAFRLNLRFVGTMGIFVAAFLVFNSISFIISRRSKEIEILRKIGASGKTLALLLFCEIGLLVVIASLLGVGLGIIGGHVILTDLSRTVATLYAPPGSNSKVITSWLDILLSAGICSVIGLFGAALPIVSVTQVIPKLRLPVTALAWCGLAVVLVGILLTKVLNNTYELLTGFLPPVLIAVGCTLIVPKYVELIPILYRPLIRVAGVVGLIAQSSIISCAERVRPTVAALGVAISLLVATDSMVGSFRSSVQGWLARLLDADLYVSASELANGVSSTGLSPAIIEFLHTHPEVSAHDDVFSKVLHREGRRVQLTGVDFGILARNHRIKFLDVDSEILSRDDAVLLSESYVNRYGRTVGTLDAVLGERRIAGVFQDYSAEHGLVYLPREQFRKIFPNVKQQSMAVYLKEGIDPERFKKHLNEEMPTLVFNVQTQEQLTSDVLGIFDRTFVLTYSLQLIALTISMFVVVNTVAMLAVERGRQLAMLHAIGMTAAQQRLTFIVESVLLGMAGGIFGILQGVVLSGVLVFFVNRFFFGWSITYQFSFGPTLIFLIVFLTLAAIVSSLVWRKYRSNVADLRYD